MKSFCLNASVSTKHHGEFWGKMKPHLPNTRGKSQNKIVLVDSERVVTDPLSVTETFNEYFPKVGSEADCLEMEDFKDHASVTAITERNVQHHFTFKPVAEN